MVTHTIHWCLLRTKRGNNMRKLIVFICLFIASFSFVNAEYVLYEFPAYNKDKCNNTFIIFKVDGDTAISKITIEHKRNCDSSALDLDAVKDADLINKTIQQCIDWNSYMVVKYKELNIRTEFLLKQIERLEKVLKLLIDITETELKNKEIK